MTFGEHRKSIDPEHAVHYVARMRDMLDKLRAIEGEDVFERQRALLQIVGFPRVRDETELKNIIDVFRHSAYPSRSYGCGR